MAQALSVWSDLEAAYYGQNGYGGDVAEIYAYRLSSRCPTAETLGGQLGADAKAEQARRAAASLFAILSHFAKEREARVTVDGRRLGRWLLKYTFDHRVHVKVERR